MRRLAGIAIAVIVLGSMPVVSTAAVVPGKPSDFNGDGYTDLAIGVPGEVVGGFPFAGGVNVLYGSPTGITSAGDQFWSQDSPAIPGESAEGNSFGTAIASGDFDRDGFADLAIGAPRDLSDTADYGSVTILYGKANGLAADAAQTWREADLGDLPGNGVFGSALAAGDYDGDGFTDLAVGALDADFGGALAPGAVDILFGGSDGLAAEGGLQFSQDSPGVPGDPDELEEFGFALTAGDFDGDGIDDLAIGVPGDKVSSIDSAGGVNILYGTVDGPSGVGAQLWSQDTPGIGSSPGVNDEFGKALATGDFDRDGYEDLAVGVPRDEAGGVLAGAVNVIYGSAAGLTASDSKWWHQGSAAVPGSNEDTDAFGAALATGDFNSDGADDLAVGAFGEDVGRISAAGAVTLLYGSRSGIRATGAVVYTQDTPGVPGRSESTDLFGSALAAGNYGRSGRDDLAIGAYREKTNDVRKSGAVNVLYGRLSGLSGIGAQSWTQDSPGVMGSVGAKDYFGWDLTP